MPANVKIQKCAPVAAKLPICWILAGARIENPTCLGCWQQLMQHTLCIMMFGIFQKKNPESSLKYNTNYSNIQNFPTIPI